WLLPFADSLDGAPSIDVLADATRLGLAEQAALMLREAPRLPARAGETGDWLHTAVYLALPGHRALLYPGSAGDAEVIDTIVRRGGEVLRVDPAPGGSIVSAIVDSVVAEVVGAELWQRADARSSDEG
ncbi:MAG: iron dicitrate transport regulator FecR, partial [Chloroflexota bacterium]|nr:iron dicitrate transport regulator FecR [Chloroflexota bacterium]